jgi:tetratricopeptide (TPR) repeat protein
MRVLAPLRSRFFPGAILIVSSLILAGCSTPNPRLSLADSDIAQIPKSWKPHLLYLLPSPHSRLYVEVDAVEGCVPKEAALQKIRGFLSKYCNKSDGIEIVRSDVIPIATARGISEKALARRYVNGPAKTTGSPPAFMYVLFYNDDLCEDSVKAEHSGASMAQPSYRRAANPYTDLSLYPAIYYNTRYVPWYFPGMDKKGLLHEAGHMLGMVTRPTSAPGRHCPDRACLMSSHLSAHRLLFGQQKQLCRQCAAELAQDSMQSSPSNLRFVGSILVRSEAGYHVLSLPDRLAVIVGDLAEQDCQDFAAHIRAETPSVDRRERVDCLLKDDVLKEPANVSELINRLKADPFDQVRVAAPKVLLRLCARRYDTRGQYSNTVAILHQAILLDSKDDWSYNQLAWIKATCPDASIRNGNDAVSAATKACELTEWKNWRFIDTLAAAYAQAGDFKRAIEFQEQALRTGNPTESEQKRMRERIALYKQSQPFRENSDKR